jgi:hypothetical protein
VKAEKPWRINMAREDGDHRHKATEPHWRAIDEAAKLLQHPTPFAAGRVLPLDLAPRSHRFSTFSQRPSCSDADLREVLRLLHRTWEIERKAFTEAGIGMLAEYWFRIFKESVSPQGRSTRSGMTAVNPREYAQAHVPSTLRSRDIETDFEETVPNVFHDDRSQ